MRRSFVAALALGAAVHGIAGDLDETIAFPAAPPVRERVFRPDDQAAWTLRTGDQAVPLNVVPAAGGVAVALGGGWILLDPDLGLLPDSFDWLASSEPGGTPWAQEAGGAIVSVTGSPGELSVLYPETAVRRSLPFPLADLSEFAITDQGFLFVEGRRTMEMAFWGADLKEGQPLPFFAADVCSADDGTAWAVDSLQARPWRRDEGLWKPLDLPKTPGRLTTLVPFPDSSGYFGAGAGWVGAFQENGTPYWIRTRDLAGKPLPLDLHLRAGPERLYLWSAQSRCVWAWGWNASGPVGTVGAPFPEDAPAAIKAEIARLTALGSLPEALSVARYGLELAAGWLQKKPFDTVWTAAQTEFQADASTLRTRVIGAGVFQLSWSQPFDAPLASWTWQPDATWLDVKAWRVHMLPYWEGRAFEPRDFKIPVTGDRAPWPGVDSYHLSALQLPSWMDLEFRPDGADQSVHWTRQPLPAPPKPYDLPVE